MPRSSHACHWRQSIHSIMISNGQYFSHQVPSPAIFFTALVRHLQVGLNQTSAIGRNTSRLNEITISIPQPRMRGQNNDAKGVIFFQIDTLDLFTAQTPLLIELTFALDMHAKEPAALALFRHNFARRNNIRQLPSTLGTGAKLQFQCPQFIHSIQGGRHRTPLTV